MSRRKDRGRFQEKKRRNPDYVGFRGFDSEPEKRGQTPTQTVACSVCGRKRNVAVGIALEAGDNYVCLACSEAQKSPHRGDD